MPKKVPQLEREHYIRTTDCPACHYRYAYDYDDKKVIEGKEEFIDVDVTATYEDTDGYHRSTNKLDVIMCPKCGTLKGNL